nr:hypothetical protein [Escherichia coli]
MMWIIAWCGLSAAW